MIETKQKSPIRSERDEVPVGKLAALVVGLLGALIVVSLVVVRIFNTTTQQEIFAKQLAPVPAEVIAQRAKDAAALNGYDVIDKAAGLYHIPIERALEYLVAHPEKLAPWPKARTNRGAK